MPIASIITPFSEAGSRRSIGEVSVGYDAHMSFQNIPSKFLSTLGAWLEFFGLIVE
ncbi:hypothetical protein [Cupriavidus oxalaticus]|uniref:Uncharacterized protein n=1 Tax=Cupriavidus oxalaticus TaxID=96344 RepID=A0A375FMD5_9BURK|nr:hypothetical protein [Cupriavidus oxalaticus]QRQ85848.1 hypothetical protein JTE91_21530 [Cupriavidus oxalaticus]QRQ95826.1 hypothetical protein JTE92_20730 [Cupriavidus oxalaticus]WQD84502.1 hypothetical protein U0036_08470 [Cupriavidus oxalaticus]SPC06580.1 hypothetical protein CO2235_U600025 [Cupriavidus oxalaticus]SPC12439.1 hypothetical protein CO2235_150094 [Cupriavidus oxalaticus]